MSDTSKMREEFEAWYLAEYYEGDKQCGLEWLSTEPCGGYRYSEPSRAWAVWQASRQAVVVELKHIDPLSAAGDSEAEAFNNGVHSAKEVIEAQGLRCEVKS